MWRHIKPILQVIILATAMLVSFLNGAVLENTTKCPRTFYLDLVHTKWQLSHNLNISTLGWNLNSFHKVNQEFKHFVVFSILPCKPSICNAQKKWPNKNDQFTMTNWSDFAHHSVYHLRLQMHMNKTFKNNKAKKGHKNQLKCYQIYFNFYFIHINIIQ